MHIIIIGGGNVGQHIAKKLIEKNQSVLLIDKDEAKIEAIRSKMDMNLICGNGANVEVLEKAKIHSAKMVIAVMQNDDANILACMIAKTFSKEITTIARVRNPESAGSIDVDTYGLNKKQVGLDVIVSPEQAVAEEMIKTIYFPNLDEVDYFAKDKIKLIGNEIREKSKINGMKVGDIHLPDEAMVIGILRKSGKFVFPSKGDTLREGDKVYFMGTIQAIRNTSKLLYHESSRIKRVLILGGGKTGYTLAKELESGKGRSFIIKLIEANAKRCEELSQSLSKTLIIKGDGTDYTYYNEEEIQETDVLVTATGDDRVNLIASVIGKEAHTRKILNALESTTYESVYPIIGLKTVINPQLITAEKIMRYIHKEKVASLAVLNDDVEVFEVILEKGCKVEEEKIKDANFPKEALIGAIVRGGNVIMPNKDTVLKSDDHLVIVAQGKSSLSIGEFFVAL